MYTHKGCNHKIADSVLFLLFLYLETGTTKVPAENATTFPMTAIPIHSTKQKRHEVALPLAHIHINSNFGMRRDPFQKDKKKMHYGIDLKADYEKVFSMMNGVVCDVGYSRKTGKYISIQHDDYICTYSHLHKIYVKENDSVKAGRVVALSGNTGIRSTGPHLHMECRKKSNGKHINPLLVLGEIADILLDDAIR